MTMERAQQFFSLIAQCDAVISLLPSEFSNEQQQLAELVRLKKEFYEATLKLRIAESKAAYYQKTLQNVVHRAGEMIHHTEDQLTRSDL